MDQPRYLTDITDEPAPSAPARAAAPPPGRGRAVLAAAAVVVAVALVASQVLLVTTLRSTNDELAALRADVAGLEGSVAEVSDDVAAVGDDVTAVGERVEEMETGPITVSAGPGSAAPTTAVAPADPVTNPPAVQVTRGLPRFDGDPGNDPAQGMVLADVGGFEYYQSQNVTYGHDGSTARAYFIWAHWCPYCQQEIPIIQDNFDAWAERYGNVEIVSITTAVDEGRGNPLLPYLDAGRFPFPVLMDQDGTLSSQFGVSAFPFWVFVDPDGVVLARVAGLLPAADLDNVFGQLEAIAAG